MHLNIYKQLSTISSFLQSFGRLRHKDRDFTLHYHTIREIRNRTVRLRAAIPAQVEFLR
jgi:hypothetical protein